MQKIMSLLTCLFLLNSFLMFGAEAPAPHIDVAKLLAQKQEEHRDVIWKGEDIIGLYGKRLEALAQSNGDGDSTLNYLFGKFQYAGEQLKACMQVYGNRKNKIELNQDNTLIRALQANASLIKGGLDLAKTKPEIELKIKVAADCLSRIVTRHFPTYNLDWTQEPPMREKTQSEKDRHTGSLIYTKTHIRKGRMVARAYHGWMSALFGPLAALSAYVAVKKPNYLTGGLAAALTAWAGYNGYQYNRVINLPAPTDDDAYKIWAFNMKPKFTTNS